MHPGHATGAATPSAGPATQPAFAAYERGELIEAERLCRDALAADGNCFEAHHLLAVIAARHGRHEQALAGYDHALRLRPDDAQALSNRGVTLGELGRHAEALASYERALALAPDHPAALSNRGNALRGLKRFEEALASFDRALALSPQFPEALSNRGTALYDLQRYEEALASYDRALALRPGYAHALSNRGLALQQLERFVEAMASFDKALSVHPDYQDCHSNRALLLLLCGMLRDGWREYEWRRRSRAWLGREFAAPEWGGGDIAGKRLLLYAEQGLGDTIQFARFASLLAARGSEVTLEVPPALGALLQTLPGGVRIVRQGELLPGFDAHLPLMSVPFVLGIEERQIPAETPYLAADPARVEAWANRLPDGEFRIGVAWQGNPRGDIDHGRSIPLAALAPLAQLPGVRLVSLQKGAGTEQLAGLPPGLEVADFGPGFDAGPDGFLDTAAVMMHLDLVVTSDSTIAHLAGALGRPVWVLLKQVPDWRWLIRRPDTPWYPTARLFRQSRQGDWDAVVARVAEAVTQLRGAPNARPRSRGKVAQGAEALPAYVINLARRADRRERFFGWNAAKGLDIAVFEAIDGSTLNKAELFQAGLIDDEDLSYSPGALGIAMSHRRLWELCRDSGRPMIIFEDDAFVPDSMRHWAAPIAREMTGEGCDLLYIGYNRDAILSLGYGGQWGNIAFDTGGLSFEAVAQRHDRWSTGDSHCILETRLAWGILAYAITPRAAELLLKNCFPLSAKLPVVMYGSGRVLMSYGLDCSMNTLIQRGIVRARAIYPPLVIGPNDPADSDNLNRRR